MVEIFIENIIASSTISGTLELESVIKNLPNCEYNPDRFPGVIFKPEQPKVVVLLFNTGKIMITAARSVDDVEKAIQMVEAKLKKAKLLTPIKPAEEKKKEEGEAPAGEGAQGEEKPKEEKEKGEKKPEETEKGKGEEEPKEKEKEGDKKKGKEKPGDAEKGKAEDKKK